MNGLLENSLISWLDQQNFDPLKILGFIGGSIVGLWTFVKGINEYSLKNRLSRYQQFISQRKEFEATSVLTNIYGFILDDSQPDLSQKNVWDRIFFLVFMENIAIMMNSGLLSKNVVHNTWGNGILRCYANDSFWKGIDDNRKNGQRSPYWRVFYQLRDDMEAIDRRVRNNPGIVRHYRF